MLSTRVSRFDSSSARAVAALLPFAFAVAGCGDMRAPVLPGDAGATHSKGLDGGTGTPCTGAPATPLHGTVTVSGSGQEATTTCFSGFALGGPAQIDCKRDGTWPAATPCGLPCPTIAAPANGIISGTQPAGPGVGLSFQCNVNFLRVGPQFLTCQVDGTWDGVPPTCNPTCVVPTAPANGAFSVGSNIQTGSVVTYSCSAGYTLQGSATSTCNANRTWSTPAPTCAPPCTRPTLWQGFVAGPATTAVGSSVSYSCKNGYALAGVSSSTCQANGTWNQPIPRCVEPCFGADFNSNGLRDDHGCWNPTTGVWTAAHGTTPIVNVTSSAGAYVPLVGDVDSNGRVDDLVLWNPATLSAGAMHTNGAFIANIAFGGFGDIPMNGNFDTDGRFDDWASWNPTTGLWRIRLGGNTTDSYSFVHGTVGDIPLVADVDGNGVSDVIIYRPANPSGWFARTVNNAPIATMNGVLFGEPTDRPSIANFPSPSSSDSKFDDICVFGSRANSPYGNWSAWHLGATGPAVLNYPMGSPSSFSVVGDFDSNSRLNDFAIRESLWGNWFAYRMPQGTAIIEDSP